MTIKTINPATGKIISTYPLMTEQEVSKIIDQSQEAFLIWSKKNISERAKHFFKTSEILLEGKDNYSNLIATEMGKPLKSAGDEIEKCALVCRHFAENTKTYLASRIVKTEMSKSYVTYTPLGIVFAIMPWNFPFW